MAEKSLVDVPSRNTVSAAEVEAFKLERSLEKDFLGEITSLTNKLEEKVGKFHPYVASMRRFLRPRIG